jgi:hypothetical protein
MIDIHDEKDEKHEDMYDIQDHNTKTYTKYRITTRRHT